ncbi:hypothetical protein [Streptomyces sp. NPDC004680]|uniref:hypothetical protein n=1 Tax=Streptomyces sp. NPDC004680 TaxID=3154287 RepID=UPI00339EC6AF
MKVGIARGTLGEGSNQRLSELRVGRGLTEGFQLSLTRSDVYAHLGWPERASYEGNKSGKHLSAGLASSAASESQ